MESIKTNRDFYLGISALRKSKEDDETLSLEQYLENLLHWSQPHGERISLSLSLVAADKGR